MNYETPKFSKFDKKLDTLGKGISGQVELFETKKGIKYAVKTYYSRKNYESKKDFKIRILHEYDILSKLSHWNIIQQYKYDVSFSGSTIKLFMMAGSPNLLKLLRSNKDIDQNELLCFWKQICQGIKYLHNLNICHRDLKLENLVFDLEYRFIKIIDFTTAHEITKTNPYSIGLVGSENYAAPETFASLKYDGKASDIWSIGIILCYLMNKKYPWKSAQWNDENYKQYQSQFNSNEKENISLFNLEPDAIKESQILNPDAEQRISIFDFDYFLWFENIRYCNSSTTCGYNHNENFR
ncbi:uncharacterized protein KGF55_005126 [Candida pseudojiufengensis]|uniref:uncharacterized protein n=1 Tax=Candida pseudojiufengensis TaxID=497109 RepID=UPI0022254185|nr:uncharacterized protein KGF55_005126 [Candida pseudojiufengensis]KAI5959894.1 hypothetical protein KGF55_005126 [Candida pseudojiufengensis]